MKLSRQLCGEECLEVIFCGEHVFFLLTVNLRIGKAQRGAAGEAEPEAPEGPPLGDEKHPLSAPPAGASWV